ncbi:MAG: hypothetical protein QM715_18245 [Nibricoccus sp.]
MPENPFIQIRAPFLGIMPGEEDELVNDGMYGKALALYLQKRLSEHGYRAPRIVCEDWGWWVTVADLPFSCGLCIYGVQIGETNELDLCVTVSAAKERRWSWKLFRFIDTTSDVEKLHGTVRKICDLDSAITVVGETADYPLA